MTSHYGAKVACRVTPSVAGSKDGKKKRKLVETKKLIRKMQEKDEEERRRKKNKEGERRRKKEKEEGGRRRGKLAISRELSTQVPLAQWYDVGLRRQGCWIKPSIVGSRPRLSDQRMVKRKEKVGGNKEADKKTEE